MESLEIRRSFKLNHCLAQDIALATGCVDLFETHVKCKNKEKCFEGETKRINGVLKCFCWFWLWVAFEIATGKSRWIMDCLMSGS